MVDSEPIAREAWNAVLRRFGVELDDHTASEILGLRLEDSSALILRRFGLPLSVEEIGSERRAIFDRLAPARLCPMPGLAELLAAVDQRGIARAVATSGYRGYVEAALQTIRAADGFGAIVTGEMISNGKPAPDIYLAAARALSLPAASCLALEDAPHGIRAAKQAGMVCVAVPNRLTANLDLSAADRILPSLMAVTRDLDWLVQSRAIWHDVCDKGDRESSGTEPVSDYGT